MNTRVGVEVGKVKRNFSRFDSFVVCKPSHLFRFLLSPLSPSPPLLPSSPHYLNFCVRPIYWHRDQFEQANAVPLLYHFHFFPVDECAGSFPVLVTV